MQEALSMEVVHKLVKKENELASVLLIPALNLQTWISSLDFAHSFNRLKKLFKVGSPTWRPRACSSVCSHR